MKRIITYIICTIILWGCEDILPPKSPIITNLTVTDITESTAICTFKIEPAGGTQKAGVKYCPDSLFQYGTTNVSTTTIDKGNISLTLTGLSSNTLYYFIAFISDRTNSSIYSQVSQFRTKEVRMVSLSTNTIEVSNLAGNYNFHVTSNTERTIASIQTLCAIHSLSGYVNSEVNVHIRVNTNGRPHTDRTLPR